MTPIPTIRMYAYTSAWVELRAGDTSHLTWGIGDGNPNSRVADVGELTVTLNNYDGIYSPDSPTALAGWKLGIPFKMVVTFDGEDFVRFRGNISRISIKPNNKDKKAYITVLDWLDYSTRHPIINPGVQSNKRGDEIITTVLSEVEVAPQAQTINTGTETFPTAFDTVTSKTTAYSEFAKVALSELGYVYLTKDRTNGETLVFEGSDIRHGWVEPDTRSLSTIVIDPDPGFLLLETGDYLLLEDGGKLVLDGLLTNNYTFDGTLDGSTITDYEAVYGEHIINRMTVYANPRRLSASNEVLFQLDKEIVLASGATFVLKGTYADPDGGLPINGQSMVTPVATTDYTMYTGSGGTGSNITSDLTVSITYGTEGFTATLVNANTATGYINKFNTRGIGIYKYNPIEHAETNASSINTYGTQSESLNQKYQTTLYSARVFAQSIVDEYKEPKTVLNSVTFYANKSSSCMLAFLYNDIGDMVYIDIPEIGIQGNHYIQGVELTIKGSIIMVKWILLAALSLQSGLSPIAVEFNSSNEAIDYGVMPRISGLTSRTYALWINTNTLSGPKVAININSGSTDSSQLYFFDSRVYYSHTWSVNGGWRTNQNPSEFTLNSWTLLVLTYDKSSASNDPILYINGSSVTLNEFSTPSGTAFDETGRNFSIGGSLFNTGYSNTVVGKIYDPRVYNRILSPAEVTTLYNGGTPDETLVTNGLVFQGFNVKTDELADYEDVTLTSTMKLRDNAYGAIGTPSGTPIGRAKP